MPGSSREEKLRGILQMESTKMGRMAPRERSIFRETLLDTHKTGPTEAFDAAYQNASCNAATYGSAAIAGNTINAARQRALKRSQRQQMEQRAAAKLAGPVEFRSVFKPTPEQEYVCSLAKEHRDRKANCEWALLDTLEVQLHLDDRDARARRYKALQTQQHHHLDDQMAELEGMAAQEAAGMRLDKHVLEEELERYKDDQAAKAAAQRAAQVALRKQQESMLNATRTAKANAASTKKALEAQELQDIAMQLEQERLQKAAKAAAAKKAMDVMKQENEQRIAARQADAARQKAEDEALMRQTIATLDKQEKEREQKMKDFIASVAARADRAGQQAVAENRERAEREARLIKQFESQKEREYEAKQAALHAKKQAQKQQITQSREDFLCEQAAKKEAAAAAMRAERQQADAAAEAEAVAHARKMAAIKGRAFAHKDFLRTQMTESERRLVVDDTSMSAREQELNARLLNHAVRIVGRPQQFSVQLY